jgi:hypothetical protein
MGMTRFSRDLLEKLGQNLNLGAAGKLEPLGEKIIEFLKQSVPNADSLRAVQGQLAGTGGAFESALQKLLEQEGRVDTGLEGPALTSSGNLSQIQNALRGILGGGGVEGTGLPGHGTVQDAIEDAFSTGRGLVGGAEESLQYLRESGFPGQKHLQNALLGQLQLGQGGQSFAGTRLNEINAGGIPGTEDAGNVARGLLRGLPEGLKDQLLENLGVAQAENLNLARGGSPLTGGTVDAARRLFGGARQLQAAGVSPNPSFMDLITQRALGAGGGLNPFLAQSGQIGQIPDVEAGTVGIDGVSTPGIQGNLQNILLQQMTGGGLTPEFVQAQRELILDPSKEQLLGNLNQLGGGQGSLGSGLPQELLRRQERDFNNQLLAQGFEAQQNALGLGGQLGQALFGQGLANQNLGLGAQQFNVGSGLQAQEANQQAALQRALAQGGFGQQTNLANQQAQLGAQGLGVNAGLQGLGLLPGLNQQDINTQQFNAGQGLGARQFQQQMNLQQMLGGSEIQNQLFNQALQSSNQLNQGGLQGLGLEQQAIGQGLGAQNQLFNQTIGAAGLAGQLGDQGIGRSLDMFNSLGSQVQNLLGQVGQLGSWQQQQGLQNFQGLNDTGMNFMNLANQIGMGNIQGLSQIQQGQQGLDLQALGTSLQALLGGGGLEQSLAGQGQNFFNQGIAQALQQSGQGSNILSSLLAGETQRDVARLGADAAASAANKGFWGNLAAAAGLVAAAGVSKSSKVFKEDIEEFDTKEAADVIRDLDLVGFKYKKGLGIDNGKDHVGFILEDSDPRLATEDGSHIDQVNILGFLVGAIKDLQAEVERLK